MRSLNVLLAILISLVLGLGVLEGGLRQLPGGLWHLSRCVWGRHLRLHRELRELRD